MRAWLRTICSLCLMLTLISALSVSVFAENEDGKDRGGGTGGTTAGTDVKTPQSRTLLPFNYKDYSGVSHSLVEGSGGGAAGVVTVTQKVFATVKGLLGPILVFLFAGLGINLIVARGQEEEMNKAGKNFLYLLIGTAFVIFAQFLSDTITLYSVDDENKVFGFLTDAERAKAATTLFSSQLELVIIFIRYMLGGIALFYTIKSGAVIIFASGEEETVTKEKETFMYGFVGFVLIIISNVLVDAVFDLNSSPPLPDVGEVNPYAVSHSVNVGDGIGLITNVTNFVLALFGSLALFTLVAGGALYALNAGNEERGKQATQLIYGSLLGLVIAFSAYTIVAEFSQRGALPDVSPRELVPELPSEPPAAPIPPASAPGP
ncbi:MAG: hypothetical protein Q8P95_02250 [bacterium]|nr:hypothetical protein [bacterium]